ncbi:hypothetical protein [Methylotuvimicrobium sp. KM1]|uniref:hypothetical protein n=1 Tax=Methylotuvimicrobium sp. KM1 TaxID=3377707 RepID=UPI00384B4BBC
MKLSPLILFATTLGYSLITQADGGPLKAPSLFDKGPAAMTAINLKTEELTSLMLLDSAMDIAKSAALATGCESVEGDYSIEISADGAINKPVTNVIKIVSPGKSDPLILNAIAEEPDAFLGQVFTIKQAKNNKLKETLISEFSGTAHINRELTLLSIQGSAIVLGQNNTPSPYPYFRLKHFYEEPKSDNSQYLSGWGLASLSKEGFPVNKFWVRSKALKTDGQLKRVVLQEDLLIGFSACRIVIDSATDIKKKTDKQEKQKSFAFKGTMTISKSQPNEKLPKANEI